MEICTFEHRFQWGLDQMAGLPLDEARRHYDLLCASFAPPINPELQIDNRDIETIPIRHYRPVNCRPGIVLYVHGGGFSLGSLDSHQGVAASLADRLGREVVSIGYRLMPEARYSQAIADCRTVFNALAPVAMVGDSAGARLLMDTLAETPNPPALGLIYPLLGNPTELTLGPDAPLLSQQDVIDAWHLIKEDAPVTEIQHPPSNQLAILAVARDPLTAPLEQAINAWQEEGAELSYHCAPDMLHACLHAREDLPEMDTAWQRFCSALDRYLP